MPVRAARSARTSTRRSRPLELVVDRVTNGKGAMPPFEGELTEQQIADVAAYVVVGRRHVGLRFRGSLPSRPEAGFAGREASRA